MTDERSHDDPTSDPTSDPTGEAAGEPTPGDASSAPEISPLAPGDASLLALIDRLAGLLERSDLDELEVQAGGTGLVLRKPSALAVAAVVAPGGHETPTAAGSTPATTAGSASRDGLAATAGSGPPSVKAPLTGIFYNAPAPGSAPFVNVGSEVAVGTVIGLIEAMKLFNEIKSDLAGRVVRVVAENGALVKAKHPLIEVEPL
ncbi:MAG: acetyl-CoA carboxylase biotin carboxyl carrier protein [Chloroflexi bacterium]|nr:acetyl-CoA carboxylase biotin carboxyl carrier protein [Chloroflexota bacterium]